MMENGSSNSTFLSRFNAQHRDLPGRELVREAGRGVVDSCRDSPSVCLDKKISYPASSPMHILLHTIALEPARWTPARVSRPLVELLPAIRDAGFMELEIFEPHLTLAPDEPTLVRELAQHGLAPVVLSSYLDLSPADYSTEAFLEQSRMLQARVARFGFRKVRLFPGRSPTPDRIGETIQIIAQRLRHLADPQPEVEFLIETHDGSLADNPADAVRLVEECERPNIGLLWQPTQFEAEAARRQFALQREFIRHIHLQNRKADGGFAPLAEGIIPWRELLAEIPPGVDATLEFVPSGVCPFERFDLAKSVQEAVQESSYAQGLAP
jgi:sugar phosphate isomerase/epimerase